MIQGVSQSNGVLAIVEGQYMTGDYIDIRVSEVPCYLKVKLDDSMQSSVVYVSKSPWRYYIPTIDDFASAYPFKAFAGDEHCIYVSEIKESNFSKYNLAFNPYDAGYTTGIYPHAKSNSETRGEQVFLARNAIDGVDANGGHEKYPFESWGPEVRKDIYYSLEFGRSVDVNSIDFVFRNDLPHDGYWSEFDICFDNDVRHVVNSKNSPIITVENLNAITKNLMLKNFKFAVTDGIDKYFALNAIKVWGSNQ